MLLSRKWLNEFVEVDASDRDFAEAMTLSGSKQEVTTDLSADMKNVVVGKIMKMERHPDSDHMWVLQIDVGSETTQIVTGAWNIHEGDLVPVAKHKSLLPGGVKIEKGKLRGVESNGMLCSLKELELTTEHDYPDAVIKPAALLNDYKPLDPAKPSIPADIQPGQKIFGPVVAARVLEVAAQPDGSYHTCLDIGGATAVPDTDCQNLHEGDMVAYHTKEDSICTLADLHAQQAEFPHCIADGIWILHEDCMPGDDVAKLIGRDDRIVEFEITPNRPDCLSVIGLAREAAATFRKPLKLHTPEIQGCGGSIAELVDIEIEDPELCPRYTARMVKNVKIKPSPAWMRERLRNSGVRPINNIVDITNYVMLEYGQPMHAFDFSCVEGGKILVRTAREGETIQTLDGNERKLTPSMLCICDEHRPVCVAGVMGGANSEIVGDTAQVLFESANFNGASVRRTAVALNMRSEASARYEKGLDPMNTMKAVQRACELVELLGAGEVVDGVMDVIAKDAAPRIIQLEPERINALLGTDVPESEMRAILEKLDFQLDGDEITVPSWRSDVEGMADIAEEVARFHGYNNIPVTLMGGASAQGGYTPVQQAERTVGALCRSLGYDEIITYSFISPTYYDKIGLAADSPLRKSLKILNPLGEDTSIMRTTTLPSMLEILTRNYNFRNKSAYLYELGRTYFAKESGPDADGVANEPKVLSLGAFGPEVDFFSLKGAVETILEGLRIEGASFAAVTDNPSYHPGRCAKVLLGEKELGIFGQIRPDVAGNYGVDCELYAAELSFDALFAAQGALPIYHALPKFPAVARDIAVVCDAGITVGALENCIRRGAKGLLKEVALFDIYTGTGIAPGKKSVAFNLTLRADDRSLTAAEADEDVANILALLKSELGAALR
ncbi:MAG: phenylalanine--tRNA ligase subunit beta [Oscillibacter ruminantium]|uniref:phenylalanine--tRNA ligase subunit beta n=1 Tax=Oscillibacter ruminantium TaxID=1263547 RepID=UPI002B218B6C|nr:phenylalanine--tRNA ligase subunit beta [Oscillibacter ruminantium]MEA5041010.1 phenylalanine--tRNA ligase subunit beta [Oscillibacter ruminantium]